MKIAILIAAHDEPGHVARMVRALADPRVRFFLHVDAKSRLEDFQEVVRRSDVSVVEDRVAVHWAGWSQVRATRKMIEAAQRESTFDYYILMSGTHFPIRPPAELYALLETSNADFINAVKAPNASAGKPTERFEHLSLEGGYRGTGALAQARRLLNRGLKRIRAPIPPSLKDRLWAGSAWWILRRSSIEAILAWMNTHPREVAFFQRRFCPDESVFQTALMNAVAERPRRDVTYTDWTAGGASPAMIGPQHVDKLLAPDFRLKGAYGDGLAYFARKFGAKSGDAVDLIEQKLGLMQPTGH